MQVNLNSNFTIKTREESRLSRDSCRHFARVEEVYFPGNSNRPKNVNRNRNVSLKIVTIVKHIRRERLL